MAPLRRGRSSQRAGAGTATRPTSTSLSQALPSCHFGRWRTPGDGSTTLTTTSRNAGGTWTRPERPLGSAATTTSRPDRPSTSSPTTCDHRWNQNGRSSTALAAYAARSAQVLSGKLRGRGHRAPVRDLYDLTVAGNAEPAALRTALRHLDAAAFTRNLALQLKRTEQYRAEAKTLLINPTETEAATDPAPAAARTLIANYPATWRVSRTGTSWRIDTFNVHDLHLERLDDSGSLDPDANQTADEQLGGPASELLKRTPNDSQHAFKDPTVTARILALESEASERCAPSGACSPLSGQPCDPPAREGSVGLSQ